MLPEAVQKSSRRAEASTACSSDKERTDSAEETTDEEPAAVAAVQSVQSKQPEELVVTSQKLLASGALTKRQLQRTQGRSGELLYFFTGRRCFAFIH